ncbi:FecR domain-containing protein [Dyadobacter sp. 676]|uniref:FecR domain-containing protein n=1 Tax=Dyadobacter sp. 676 TaxID=3088362 RepID=A0AAU8FGQ9_9BACT
MSDHTPWPLIAKYLAGECSPEEKLAMEWWLEEYDNLLLFRQIEAAWKQEKAPENDPAFNLESGLSKLHAKMAEQEYPSEEEIHERPRYFKISSWLAAAGILLATGLGYVFVSRQHDSRDTARVAMETRTSGAEDVVSIELPDGTQVWLNKNSKIEYPKAFKDNERQVFLEGEAFFEVVPNPEKPFIVKSDKVSTRVLGTSFDVKAYKGDETASVSVATGKVEVSKEIEAGEPIRITQLTPQQELVINTEKDETYIDIVSTFDIGAWRKEQLVFRNNTYSEVIARLEEHYGVTIALSDKNLSNCRVMANFNQGATLKDVLKLLSISNSFRYKIDGTEVTIHGGACR